MVKKVLFLSSANSARSQMAEAFLRALAGDAFEAFSAGTVPRDLHPLAIAAMAERGIDMGDQRPKGLHEFMGKERFEYLITVCDRAEKECPMFPGVGAREYWPIDDPARAGGSAEERLVTFREVRDYIEARVRRWLVERRYKPVLELTGRQLAGALARLRPDAPLIRPPDRSDDHSWPSSSLCQARCVPARARRRQRRLFGAASMAAISRRTP